MTNNAMTCAQLDSVLARYLEDELDAPARASVDAHLGACLRCAGLVRDLQGIRRDAGALSALEPSRDLWEGIAGRIAAPVMVLEPRTRPRFRVSRSVGLGVAAAALIAATATLTYLMATRTSGLTPESPVASAGRGAPGGDTTVGSPLAAAGSGVAPLSPDIAPSGAGARGTMIPAATRTPVPATVTYDQAIGQLRGILDVRRQDLDPGTVAVVENSLATIDRAINDARAALAGDPASAFLTDQLNKVLEKKLGLLRTVALLPPRA